MAMRGGTRAAAPIAIIGRDGHSLSRVSKALKFVAKEALAQALDRSAVAELIVLDVRQPYEYAGGHIKGAEHIDWRATGRERRLTEVVNRTLKRTGDQCQQAVVVVVCCEFGGKRSPQAAAAANNLIDATRKNKVSVAVLHGGYSRFHAVFPQHCDGGYVPEGNGHDEENGKGAAKVVVAAPTPAKELRKEEMLRRQACKFELEVKSLIERYKENKPLPAQLLPCLMIGSIDEANDPDRMAAEHGITHVFCCVERARWVPKRKEPATAEGKALKVMNVNAKDEEGYDMTSRHFGTFKAFMDDALAASSSSSGSSSSSSSAGGATAEACTARPKVLIHCVAGMNRSGVLAVAFVMTMMRWPLLKALRHCLETRGCLLWNESFQEQLVLFAQREGLLVLDGDDGRRR